MHEAMGQRALGYGRERDLGFLEELPPETWTLLFIPSRRVR
jgi:hypothetical protein